MADAGHEEDAGERTAPCHTFNVRLPDHCVSIPVDEAQDCLVLERTTTAGVPPPTGGFWSGLLLGALLVAGFVYGRKLLPF